MGTIADKLAYLNDTKTAIKNAIVAKGVAVPDGSAFREYAAKISDIQDVASLPTQATKTITPGTTAQTAVPSGVYTTGTITVAGDANLVPENIAEGVSIFGVTGTHSGGREKAVVNITLESSTYVGVYVYTNNNEEYTVETVSSSRTLNVSKNTIVYITKRSDFDFEPAGDILEYLNASAMAVFFVSGNCSITHANASTPMPP